MEFLKRRRRSEPQHLPIVRNAQENDSRIRVIGGELVNLSADLQGSHARGQRPDGTVGEGIVYRLTTYLKVIGLRVLTQGHFSAYEAKGPQQVVIQYGDGSVPGEVTHVGSHYGVSASLTGNLAFGSYTQPGGASGHLSLNKLEVLAGGNIFEEDVTVKPGAEGQVKTPVITIGFRT